MRIGVDLGGTKIEAALLDDDAVLSRRRVSTPHGDYAGTVETVAALVQALEAEFGLSHTPVGIGHPGSIAPDTGLLRNANSTCLNGRPFAMDIREALGRPVALANDANCLALSELHDGAAKGHESAFLVILGTGVGGAVVQNGRMQMGANALAGEWGHNPLPWPRLQEVPGPACWCGLQGCLESWLSGPALSREHELQFGQKLTAAQIAEQAERGERSAQQSLTAYQNRLARALASVINLLDPQVIILAGGLSQIECLYDGVPQQWGEWIFAESVTTKLLPAHHGDASGALGAARLEN